VGTEMLIREAVENAEQGFTVILKNRIIVAPDSPSIDLIIYGLEKTFAVITSVRE
jgi:hypothetical protein